MKFINQVLSSDGIILNAGGYTHTSVAITDAIAAVTTPVIEVHITNILHGRSSGIPVLLEEIVQGSISGFGLDSYRLAVEALIEMNKTKIEIINEEEKNKNCSYYFR